MANFRDVLTASDTELVKLFYRLGPSAEIDFIKRINRAAAHLSLNHHQLVCALGFNRQVEQLTDVLTLIGFSSYKLLGYRRNELFSTDAYRQLPLENVVDVYAEAAADEPMLATLRELVPARLKHVEQCIERGETAAVSYRMEVHSLYTAGIADGAFALRRLGASNGDKRALVDELQLILSHRLIPPSNLFFPDDLSLAERWQLIASGAIPRAMIDNRLQNAEISEDERQLLEDAL